MENRSNSTAPERKSHPVAAIIGVLAVAVGAALTIPSSSGAAPLGTDVPDAEAAMMTTAWCGNGCSSSQDNGIECTDWTPGTGSSSQTCQAKAVCTGGDDCSVWPTEDCPPDVRRILSVHRKFTAERYPNGDGYGVILTPND
jgi:hypothetical protein